MTNQMIAFTDDEDNQQPRKPGRPKLTDIQKAKTHLAALQHLMETMDDADKYQFNRAVVLSLDTNANDFRLGLKALIARLG